MNSNVLVGKDPTRKLPVCRDCFANTTLEFMSKGQRLMERGSKMRILGHDPDPATIIKRKMSSMFQEAYMATF